jgi:ferrochelatase
MQRMEHGVNGYDAVLVMSFGGPEGPADVVPFLENVTRGRNVSRDRLLQVAHHYERFGGVSPINDQNRALIGALERELETHGPRLPVYFGNRNWHPFLPDTLRRMRDDGVRRALMFVTSAYSSYSGCRQYREDVQRAQQAVGVGAPAVDKLRVFYNHPGFVEPNAQHLRRALEALPAERRADARIFVTAHSVPVAMARCSAYELQLREAARLVAAAAGGVAWCLAYQSRSGPPHVPWLEPDITAEIERVARQGAKDVIVLPLGFISDHMEVMYDLDVEAAARARELGLSFTRVATVGTAPAFVAMIRELILERLEPETARRALGAQGPSHDVCAVSCCLPEPAAKR